MRMKTRAGTRLRSASVTLLLVTAFVVLQSAPTAGLQAGEPSEVMKQFLESSPPAAGAHGQSDPHAGLSAEKMAQVALAHLDESRTQLAFQTLDTAIARYPENAMLLSIRASMLLQGQRTSEALADLNHALEINPHDPVLLTNRAQALRQFDRREDAMHDLDQALKLDPGFVAALFNRGSLYFEAGRFDQALADFDRCVELEPAAPAGYFNRAATLDALGERQRAIADLRHFLTLPAEPGWQQIARDMLQQWDSDQS
jgi:tetratricopeptide (TPR) repeat protein